MDGEVDKSFCKYCQKSFKSAKAYNNHVRGMVHITLYNEAKAAEASGKWTETSPNNLHQSPRQEQPEQKQPIISKLRAMAGDCETEISPQELGYRPVQIQHFGPKEKQPRASKRAVRCDNETKNRVERHWRPRQNQQWRPKQKQPRTSKSAIAGEGEDESDSSGHEERTFCKYCQRSFTHFSAYYNHARGMIHHNLKMEAKAAKKAAQQLPANIEPPRVFTTADRIYGKDGFGSAVIPQALQHDREGGNSMRNCDETPDSGDRYGDHFGNGSVCRPTLVSPDYSHGRQASEGEVLCTRERVNSCERDSGYSKYLYGSVQRDRGDVNEHYASSEKPINNINDRGDTVNREKIFIQKRKIPFEQESDCIKKLKELSDSDLVYQNEAFNFYEQGMEYKTKSDGPGKRDGADRKRKKIVINRYKKECDEPKPFEFPNGSPPATEHPCVPEHKVNKIKNLAGQKISDDSGKELENKACDVSQRRLKLYLKELDHLKSLEQDLKGRTNIEEQTINENKALQEELQKEINKLIGHQNQILVNDAIPEPFEKDLTNIKSKDHGSKDMDNSRCEENFFSHGQFASKDGSNEFMPSSVMLKHGMAKSEFPVLDIKIMNDRNVHTLPVIKHSDEVLCNETEVNEDIKQIIFDKLTLKPYKSRREFLKLQWQDPSLADIRKEFELGTQTISRGGKKITKFIEKDTLIHKMSVEGEKYSYQLVVPSRLREDVMQLAHESLSEEHLSNRKTLLRIQKEFHWPDLKTDVRMFCRYCLICNNLLKDEIKMGYSDTNSSEDAEESSSDSEVGPVNSVINKSSGGTKQANDSNEDLQDDCTLHDSAGENVFWENSLFSNSSFSLEDFAKAQLNDPKLAPILKDIERGIERVRVGKQKGTVKFVKKENLICRQYTENDEVYHQLVVPHIYRKELIKLAHESPVTYHLGKKQTRLKMLREFHWHDLQYDVQSVCESCPVCYKKWTDTIGGDYQTLYNPNDSNNKEVQDESALHDPASENESFKKSLFSISSFSLEEFADAQLNDPKLGPILRDVESGIERVRTGKKKGTVKFVKKENLIYRQYTENDEVYHQLVVPHIYRRELIKLAHESPVTYHLGKIQTRLKMLREFYWQGLQIDVKLVCESCPVCYKNWSNTIGGKEQKTGEAEDCKTHDEVAKKGEALVDLLFNKFSCEEFKEALKKDTDLNDIRHGAESGQDVTVFGTSHKFMIKEDLIYRQATSERASHLLVVPSSFCEQVLEIAHVSPNGTHLSKTQTRKRLLHNFFWPGSFSKTWFKIGQFCSTCQSKKPEISREEEIRREKKKTLRDAALKLLDL